MNPADAAVIFGRPDLRTLRRVLERDLAPPPWHTEPWEQRGARGWRLWHVGLRMTVLATIEIHDDGHRWLHASISHPERDPTYMELKTLHIAVFGETRWSYQVFPPAAHHVNYHEHTLHLWGREDGTEGQPALDAIKGRT